MKPKYLLNYEHHLERLEKWINTKAEEGYTLIGFTSDEGRFSAVMELK